MRENVIRETLEEARRLARHGRATPEDLIQALERLDVQLQPAELGEILSHDELIEWECPGSVASFICEYAQAVGPIGRLLDVWASGWLVLELIQALDPDDTIALCPKPWLMSLASHIAGSERVRWRVSDMLAGLSESDGLFDLIVGCLPIGLGPRESVEVVFSGRTVRITDWKPNLVIASACSRLAEEGVGIFVVGPRFAFPDRRNSFFSMLRELGLYVEAYVSTPPGTWRKTSLPFGLAFVRQGQSDSLFVGELSNIRARNGVLLSNLLRHEAGSDIGLGRVVSYVTFQGYQHLVGQERVAELEDRLGIPGIPLAKIATAINLSKATKEGPDFDEDENAIYVPLIGRSDVKTLLSDLTLKPHNYAQVVLDETQADARYVAGFLNSPDGLTVRESVLSGVTIPKITKSSIQYMPIFLPDLDTSRAVLAIDTQLRELQSEVGELRTALWASPLDVESAAERLSRVNRGDSLVDWLESLPFPLATILWAYWTDREDDLRAYKRLLHFFEALAELLADVVVSAFLNDPQLFASEWEKLRGSLAETGSTLNYGTFGLWVRIFERFAKVARGLLSGKPQEAASRCGELFRSRDIETVSRLISGGIIGVLQKANALRNKDAHGGGVGEVETRRRHDALRDLLESARSEFAGAWARLLMLMPSSMEFEHGIYMTASKAIIGTRTPFDSISVRSSHPMAKNRLYFMGRGDEIALELQPLLRIMPSPLSEENACYFYNRRVDGKARFVSYHFDADADVLIDAPDTLAFLDELMGK